jgi:hypothetical protein
MLVDDPLLSSGTGYLYMHKQKGANVRDAAYRDHSSFSSGKNIHISQRRSRKEYAFHLWNYVLPPERAR